MSQICHAYQLEVLVSVSLIVVLERQHKKEISVKYNSCCLLAVRGSRQRLFVSCVLRRKVSYLWTHVVVYSQVKPTKGVWGKSLAMGGQDPGERAL